MPAQTFMPGHRQVEEFGPDKEYEEEEDYYIILDLGTMESTLCSTVQHIDSS